MENEGDLAKGSDDTVEEKTSVSRIFAAEECGRVNVTKRTETCSILTSALSLSAFNSSSTFRQQILGSLNDLGCCSNPA